MNATAPINDYVDLSEYRPITPQEKAVLTALLERSGRKRPPSCRNSKA